MLPIKPIRSQDDFPEELKEGVFRLIGELSRVQHQMAEDLRGSFFLFVRKGAAQSSQNS